jgi:hypothetical protein
MLLVDYIALGVLIILHIAPLAEAFPVRQVGSRCGHGHLLETKRPGEPGFIECGDVQAPGKILFCFALTVSGLLDFTTTMLLCVIIMGIVLACQYVLAESNYASNPPRPYLAAGGLWGS